MAIKKLQNDFTTHEQSKRLLELGVPRWSANGLQTHRGIKVLEKPQYDNPSPCWSALRLIKIYIIARGLDTIYLRIEKGEDMVKYLIRLYEEKVKDLDFSKLEN